MHFLHKPSILTMVRVDNIHCFYILLLFAFCYIKYLLLTIIFIYEIVSIIMTKWGKDGNVFCTDENIQIQIRTPGCISEHNFLHGLILKSYNSEVIISEITKYFFRVRYVWKWLQSLFHNFNFYLLSTQRMHMLWRVFYGCNNFITE